MSGSFWDKIENGEAPYVPRRSLVDHKRQTDNLIANVLIVFSRIDSP